jgi:predicted small lipoprotein YifL
MIRRLIVLCTVLTLFAVLGCGNKGPLYLPQETAESQTETEEEQQKP